MCNTSQFEEAAQLRIRYGAFKHEIPFCDENLQLLTTSPTAWVSPSDIGLPSGEIRRAVHQLEDRGQGTLIKPFSCQQTCTPLHGATLIGVTMRLPLALPSSLSVEQRTLYDRNRAEIARGFNSLKTMDADGALLGPWGIFIQMPGVGQAHENLLDAIASLGHLSAKAKQVAIILVGAHFKAAYELYAHVAIATQGGMTAENAATLAAGLRPSHLEPDEACAYDVTFALLQGGVLPGAVYEAARKLLGQDALNELVQWICAYSTVSMMLNAYDVPSEQTFEHEH